MAAILSDRLESLSRAYQQGGDADFAGLVRAAGALPEEELADLIDLDARMRLGRGLGVDLARYLNAIPDLASRPLLLDAAVEFTLRSLSRSAVPKAEAIETLVSRFPHLGLFIRNSALLSIGIGRTNDVEGVVTGPSWRLPHDLGPAIEGHAHRYELRDLIGSGAQGRVYLAVDRLLADPTRPAWVAVKCLLGIAPTREVRDRLIEEAAKARRIEHPGVARVLDRGASDDGVEYLVYEYVKGRDLARSGLLESLQRNPRAVVRLLLPVMRAVQAAHAAGVVHRDIKPANIIVSEDGVPKISDFGSATRVGDAQGGAERPPAFIGNFAFCSPEQYRCEPGALGPGADVYALGGVLYHGLTGVLPNGDSQGVVAANLGPGGRSAAPYVRSLKPGVDADLESIVRRALAPASADRYGSVESLADDVESWLRYEAIPWQKPSLRRRASLFVRRQPIAAALAAGLFVFMVAGSALGTYGLATAHNRLLRERLSAAETLASQNERDFAQMSSTIKTFFAVFKSRENAKTSAGWWAPVTILESLAGPRLFSPNVKESADMWATRTRMGEEVIADSDKAGAGSSLEALLWKETVAFWHLRAGDFLRAELLLDQTEPRWRAMLSPQDPWLEHLGILRAVVAVQRLAEARKSGQAIKRDTPGVGEAEKTLREAERRLAGLDRWGAMHQLAYSSLWKLYGDDMLGDAEGLARLSQRSIGVDTDATPQAPTVPTP